MENAVTKKEKFSYGMYFMGQNVFYGLIGDRCVDRSE